MEDVHVFRNGQLATAEGLQKAGLAAAVGPQQAIPPAQPNMRVTVREACTPFVPYIHDCPNYAAEGGDAISPSPAVPIQMESHQNVD